LGPEDVHGQRPTQEGAEIKAEGKNGDIKINGTAKVICGGIQAQNARIYIIDKVLDPASPPEPITPTVSGSSPTPPTTTNTIPPPPNAEMGTGAQAPGGSPPALPLWLPAGLTRLGARQGCP